jgi:hypothetical protein
MLVVFALSGCTYKVSVKIDLISKFLGAIQIIRDTFSALFRPPPM